MKFSHCYFLFRGSQKEKIEWSYNILVFGSWFWLLLTNTIAIVGLISMKKFLRQPILVQNFSNKNWKGIPQLLFEGEIFRKYNQLIRMEIRQSS